MRQKQFIMFGLVLLFLNVGIGLSKAAAIKKPDSLRFFTGSAGGSMEVIGVGMANILTKAGVKTSPELGGGNSNIVNISSNMGDIGLTFTVSAYLASRGEAPFKSKTTNLRVLCVVSDFVLYMIASKESGIKSIPDLKGKPVALQQMSAGVTSLFQLALDAYGMSEKDLKIVTRGGTGQGKASIQDRRVDFFIAGATIPSGDMTEITTILPVTILSIDNAHLKNILEKTPVLSKTNIPAGTYKGQDAQIPVVGAPLIVFTRENLPDDHAYWIVKTLVENIKDFRGINATVSKITPQYMATSVGMSFHPGAVKYYKEIGIMK